MMKIFSAAFFALFLIGSWYVVNSRPTVAYETHVDMEATLIQTITQFLKQEKPNAQDFVIVSMKSEVESPANVRVYFKYQFREPDPEGKMVKITRQGQADLMKDAVQPKDAPEKWTLREGKLITEEALEIEHDEEVKPGVDYEQVYPGGQNPSQPSTSAPTEATPTPTPANK